ncbi:Uma2 family endonuclease [Spirulina major CS-329]|uniref:Uma2 family endonuclease n=1 Tax=Spirulina TaxID=1154 RepID=UPI00232CBED7|nr:MULTISPECIES: Uma2 family endonuclease [Spirulina]MDB9497015.1 Uma2 family endonuclease [Spirulina subsalsa CS-330]MDB9505363.1 Uma2 family endonuclease [Spirulina major CS-329]
MISPPILSTQYPDSDGKPMAENTLQYQWIVYLVENLKQLFAEQTAFVAGDLLWYPVQVPPGQTPPRQAPDAMVVLGRPQGDRGSYKQWEEDGIAPQVVFEIISPSNTVAEMATKQAFYAQHGVLEMYFYDPDSENFWGLVRNTADEEPRLVMALNLPWTSPLLQIRFEQWADGLRVFYPDGEPFKTLQEVVKERDRALEREAQTQRQLDRALAKLKELGIEPDTLN